MIKRLTDIIFSFLGIISIAIPMGLIALAIRLESCGGAIFRQRRVGYKGKVFTMLKFRTMRTDADPYDASPHSAEDPRLTRVGRWIREKSLDELPQLFNVLVGSMSIVGPRPLYERQACLWDNRQRGRLDVKPGLTGYAQISGRGNIAHEEKIELDLKYVAEQSFWTDMKIIGKTISIILSGIMGKKSGIYENRYSQNKERETDS